MRRFLAALSSLVILACVAPRASAVAAHNAGIPPLDHAAVAQNDHPAAPAVAASCIAPSGTIQSETQLRFPPAAFPPDFAQTVNSMLTVSEADSETIQGLFHRTYYRDLGVCNAWYQEYHKDLTKGAFIIAYLGTYYGSHEQASNAFDDIANSLTYLAGLTSIISVGTPMQCSYGDECIQVNISGPFTGDLAGPQYEGIDRIVLRSNALFETTIAVPQDQLSAQITALNGYLDSLSASWVSLVDSASAPVSQPAPTAPPSPTPTPSPSPSPSPTATSTPTPLPTSTATPTATATPTQVSTDFSVDAVKVQASSNEKSKVLKSVKVGKKTVLFIYWTLKSAPAGTKPSYAYRATLHGTTARHGSLHGALDSYDPGSYYADFHFKPRKAGKYRITGSVTFNGQTEQAHTGLTVTS